MSVPSLHRPNKFLLRSSFGLVRTNPRLTTNIKIVADSKNKIYLESIDANPLLSKSIYKGYEVSYKGSYAYDLKRFYSQNGSTLPENIAYTIFEEDSSLDIKNRYKNQYDFTYGNGFYPKNSKLYTEEYAIFAPLWLEKDNIPDYFLIFKMDGPLSINPSDPIESTSSSYPIYDINGYLAENDPILYSKLINTVITNGYPSGYTGDLDDSTELNALIESPGRFNENFIKKAKIIKTFDLKESSHLGTYIRNHINDSKFPESSIYASLERNSNTYWNGISYRDGGFCSIGNDIYKEYTLSDKTLIESDDFLTSGFMRNGVVCANLLNLEFLFDDNEQEEYKFSRYFGLFVSETEMGKFFLDKDRLYADKGNEEFQSPSPIESSYGDPTSTESVVQTNPRGIKIYPNIKLSDISNPSSPKIPYFGRLMTFDELQNPRFGYVKDVKGNFYSIDNNNNWSTPIVKPGLGINGNSIIEYDSNYLRIKNKSIDWSNFTGVEEPFEYIQAYKTSERGRPAFAFKVTSLLSNGDQIRIRYTNPLNSNETLNINNHTIVSTDLLPAGTSNGIAFSNLGSLNDISKAISQSINNIEDYVSDRTEIFKSVLIGDEIVVFCKLQSENWNKLKISFFSDQTTFPFEFVNRIDKLYEPDSAGAPSYYTSPINTTNVLLGATSLGIYSESYFTGGNNNPYSRAIVERDKVLEFYNDGYDDIYVKTETGKYLKVKNYGLYLDEPIKTDSGEIIGFKNYDKYFVVDLEDFSENIEFGSSNKVALYKLAKNSCGYLSLFPIKDFDFDFRNKDYMKSGDSDTIKLLNWYKALQTTNTNQSIFGLLGYNSLGNLSTATADGKSYITNLVGPSSTFYINGGFQTLSGMQTDSLDDTFDLISNEYDRLRENELEELALSSRVVPFINKWVYDNESVDVRENNYRLNSNPAFGYSNFSPSFDITSKNTKFFTHEWYYLQKYPPYMNLSDKINSYSYFDEDISLNPNGNTFKEKITLLDLESPNAVSFYNTLIQTPSNIFSNGDDYFLYYFTRETVEGLPIKRDFKYSLFSIGDNDRPSETLFRGVKVEIKDRTEFSKINYNKESLRYSVSDKYNGYKFSAVLTYGISGTQITCIKNDKFKYVLLLIQADFEDDDLILYKNEQLGTGSYDQKFIDRSLLYSMNDKKKLQGNALLNQDKTVQGKIVTWEDNGIDFIITGGPDSNGNYPNFSSDLTLNKNGAYNTLKVISGNLTYTFSGINNVSGNQFRCKSIGGLPIVGTIIPDSSGITPKNFQWLINSWGFSYQINSAPFNNNPIYSSGGFGAYGNIIESISFASIAQSINSGNPEIKYINVNSNDQVEFNTFCLDLIKPDYPASSTYLMRKAIEKTPADLQESAQILGYELTAMPRLGISPICRYRGTYNPKFTNIINFVDTDDLKNESLSYFNIQILTELKSNISIWYITQLEDPEFGDITEYKYFGDYNLIYYTDEKLAKIRNLYFNKVNVENPNIILGKGSKSRLVYPLIGEIAIDYDDFFTFKSNWDINYFKKYTKRSTRSSVIGTREPKEEKSFFSSKAISIPNEIILETFPSGIIDEVEFLEFGSINNTPANLVQRTKVTPRSTELTIDVYVTYALEDWLINDGFGTEFYKYINPNYSFGNIGLDDDIKLYIKENIFDRYSVKEIIFWEKIWNPKKGYANLIIDSPPQIETGLTDQEKLENGYIQSKNFRTISDNIGSLDFKLIYTIPRDKRTSIAFTVILEKK